MENNEEVKNESEIVRKEYTMGFVEANLYALLLAIPIVIIALVPYILIWGFDYWYNTKTEFFSSNFIIILIVGIVIHELLHGLIWGYFAEKGYKSIKYGISWKVLTPYCHCKEPLKVKHYRIGGIMPLIVLGILPLIVAFAIGDKTFLSIGVFFTIAAGGDIMAIYMLRNLDKETYISDHPRKMGFYVEEK